MRRCVPLLQMFIVSESHYILFLQECISFVDKLATKHVTLSVSIDLLGKEKLNLRILLRIQNSAWNTL